VSVRKLEDKHNLSVCSETTHTQIAKTPEFSDSFYTQKHEEETKSKNQKAGHQTGFFHGRLLAGR
jgi:hypothetical protein